MLALFILLRVVFALFEVSNSIDDDAIGYKTCLRVINCVSRLFTFFVMSVFQVYKKLAIDNGADWGGTTSIDCYSNGWTNYMN